MIKYATVGEMRGNGGIVFTVNGRWKVWYDKVDRWWSVQSLDPNTDALGYVHFPYAYELPTRQHVMAWIAATETKEFAEAHGFEVVPEPVTRTRTRSSGFGWGLAAGLALGGGG